MSFGALAFLNPWLLGALATLPLIYWLLRTVPPRPRQIAFPATRILVGIENKEKTPSTTPWWLLLIRLLAAALVIGALAEPVLNPSKDTRLAGDGPLVLVIDNGWAAAPRWKQRQDQIAQVINEAEQQNRPLIVVPTAKSAKTFTPKLEAPADARSTAQALQPQPFASDRAAALTALKTTLDAAKKSGVGTVWLTDSVDYGAGDANFAADLKALSDGGSFVTVSDSAGHETLGLKAGVGKNGKLIASILRADGPQHSGFVHAFSAKGQRLGEAPFNLAAGTTETGITFELPLELRNQVTRLEIAGQGSAGGINLLDGRSQWQRVGLMSGESQEKSQPLLAPLYFLQKAVQPFAEIVHPKDQNLIQGVDTLLAEKVSVAMLADIGTLAGEVQTKLEAWVKKGGILVRFGGSRLEKGGDDLLPVALRAGGRSLGGALSWSTPQPLNAFDDASPFAGLEIPAEVTINRQVLADPSRLTPEVAVWARLKDGTPLVTAKKLGDGTLVLFHITANTDWSNLPISGLFVEMLKRITTLGTLSGSSSDGATAADGTSAPEAPQTLIPIRTLDGFGTLKPPPPTAQPLTAAQINTIQASFDHPPGYYGAAGQPRSVNVMGEKSKMAPLPALPSGTQSRVYEAETAKPLKPWLLAAALALLFVDIVAVILLQTGLAWARPAARVAAVVLLATTVFAAAAPHHAFAQNKTTETKPPSEKSAPIPGYAQGATDSVTLAYVLTGDSDINNVARLGLSGLSRVLQVRTAVEPGDPVGVDIINDEIAFFPVLYWPVEKNPQSLPEATLAKIDTYMKQGGLIIFDTRDYSSGLPTGMALAGETGPALQKLLGRLDLPRLEPVPEGHVLTKSFYLLKSFPGRWDGGQMWVEAQSASDEVDGGRKARRADGVTSLIVTSNDFASAWALDQRGKPLFPVVPGGERQREMSLRSGINIVMHALTGNYKADQVHVPALLERLGH